MFSNDSIDKESTLMLLSTTLNKLNISIRLFDKNLKVIYTNENTSKITKSKNYQKILKLNIKEHLMTTKTFTFIESSNNHFYEITIIELNNNYIESIKDITAIVNTKKELRGSIELDPLTNLYTKKVLDIHIHKKIEKKENFALFLVDINNFKSINEAFSFIEGDLLLKDISQKLNELNSNVYRIAGDKFSIITELEEVEFVKLKLKEIFDLTFNISDSHIYISASVGYDIFEEGKNIHNLIQNAEIAMYWSKNNAITNLTSIDKFQLNMRSYSIADLTEDTYFKRALNNHEFELHYQPQVNINTGEIIGVEALIRWNDPDRGLVAPFKFIPKAEENGTIIPLGYEILKMAFKQSKIWENKSVEIGIMSINLSLKQLKEPNFIKILTDMLNHYNVNTDLIALEITETFIMEDPEESIKILLKIKELGIKLAMDDFGTGYSSLSYLKKLPIDKLKIDKSFIDRLINDKEDQIIVKTIIDLGKNFGLSLIAEGVETKEQQDYLQTINCEEIQGYYFSKPITAQLLEERFF